MPKEDRDQGDLPGLPGGSWPYMAKKCTYKNSVLKGKLKDGQGSWGGEYSKIQASPDDVVEVQDGKFVITSSQAGVAELLAALE